MLLGLWPYVMRRVMGLWSETEYHSFSITNVAGKVVGTLTVCTLEGPVSYILFSLAYGQAWEQEVVAWMTNLLCCRVGQMVPVGINCGLLPRVEAALCPSSGPQAVVLVPLKLSDLNQCLVDVSVRVMGGTDLHSILNHLHARLKEFVRDPILLACPKLLEVIVQFSSFNVYLPEIRRVE